MRTYVKFSEGESSPESQPTEFTFPNVWERETYPEYSRLLIGSEQHEVRRILELCRPLSGPFGVLYVLLASRLGNEPARYQSPEPIDYDDLELFLYTFQEYFEQDGRHAIWVSSLSGEGQFIFDQHNYVFAYGNLDRMTAQLTADGYSEGKVAVPFPHCHHYHVQFDEAEDEILKYWSWLKSPLEQSDNP